MEDNVGTIVIGTKVDTKGLDVGLKEVEKKVEITDAKTTATKTVSEIASGTSKISSALGGIAGKVAQIGLKAMGIASIVSLIVSIISVVAKAFEMAISENQELATNLKYLAFVINKMIGNVAKELVNFISGALTFILQVIYEIIGAIALIVKWLFNIDILAGTSAEDFRNAQESTEGINKNLGGATQKAKDLKKQLAGFDEMNVLNDNLADNLAGGGGYGGNNIPEVPEIPNIPIPEWLLWIKDNAEPLGLIMGGVAGGALLMVDGITKLGDALKKYGDDPSLENFGEVVHRVGETWSGFGMLTIDPVSTIAGSIVAISGILTNHKKEVDEWIDDTVSNINEKAEWLNENVSSSIGAMFSSLGEDIDYARDDFWGLMEEVKGDFDGISKVINKFKEGDIKGAWNEIVNWITGKIEKEKERFNRLVESLKTKIKTLINGIKTDFDNVKNWLVNNVINPLINIWDSSFNKVKTIVSNAINYVINQFSRIASSVYNMGIAIGDTIGGAIRGAVNGALNFVENKINNFIRGINNVISLINKIPGVSIGRIGYISLPRMAVGGIINQPGKGVPVGNAIVGEAGREGILPLTDKQAMAELGREIGKWISIQATVPVNIGNRQVARVIQELNNDREFAMNS